MHDSAAPTRLPSPRPAARAPAARRATSQAPGSWLARWLGRRKPTIYQRCLAVHIDNASPRSALS